MSDEKDAIALRLGAAEGASVEAARLLKSKEEEFSSSTEALSIANAALLNQREVADAAIKDRDGAEGNPTRFVLVPLSCGMNILTWNK